MTSHRRGSVTVIAVCGIVLLVWLTRSWVSQARHDTSEYVDNTTPVAAEPPETPSAKSGNKPVHDDVRIVSDEERADAIRRAHIWHRPRVPIAHARLVGSEAPDALQCRFKLSQLGGTTPKFDCLLDSGEEIRIKYGKGPEIPAEAAATRLLRALGFGADEVALVGQLRCYGCPVEPFSTMRAVEVTRAEPLYKHAIDYDDYEDFEWVALERKYQARPIETEKLEGWAFFELAKIDPNAGAPRAHVDALRLLAVFLAHWDNKSENQRLVCVDQPWATQMPCATPFLLIQDLGATFGPSKVNLEAWEKSKIWVDRARCRISMDHLPYDGATFEEVTITEPGRRFLANLLRQLSDQQLTELFAGARFDKKRGLFSASRPVADWVRVFKTRVRVITDGPACPATSSAD